MSEAPGKINILLVEDDRLMFEGLSMMLGEEPDLRVVGVATTAAEAVDKARLLEPDVVLMDYHLPDGEGTSAAARIRDQLPDAAILFLSADASDGAIQRAIESGASGYISKAAPTDQLISGIRTVAAGESLLEAATIARLNEQRRRSELRPSQQLSKAARLTQPEREVLARMAEGLGNLQIAEALQLPPPAVRGHVRRILEKLGVHTKFEALELARESGLLER